MHEKRSNLFLSFCSRRNCIKWLLLNEYENCFVIKKSEKCNDATDIVVLKNIESTKTIMVMLLTTVGIIVLQGS